MDQPAALSSSSSALIVSPVIERGHTLVRDGQGRRLVKLPVVAFELVLGNEPNRSREEDGERPGVRRVLVKLVLLQEEPKRSEAQRWSVLLYSHLGSGATD